MNFNLYDRTIYLALSGSHAYGMATETSDYDYRGIAIAPIESYIGLMDKFEQIVDSDKGAHVYKNFPVGLLKTDPRVSGADPNMAPDMQVMELTKFVRLALSNNPSVLEVLFVDDSEVVICNSIMKELIDNRERLLCKAAKARFCGYALSQLKRLNRHKYWLDNPPTHKPTREEYDLPNHSLISPDQIGAANTLIQKEIDGFMVDQTHLPEDTKIELSNGIGKMMRAVWYGLNTDRPYPVGPNQKFGSSEDALYWGAAKDQGFSENFLEVLRREKLYRNAMREWNQYQTWLKQRNKERAELEKKYSFDCYVDDTEFLTNDGWKKFDDISENDKLATVNLTHYTHRPYLGVEYQKFTDKFSGFINTGFLYHLYGNHVDCLVTPNHRMLYKKVERRSGKEYDIVLDEAASLPDTFDILIAPIPKKTTFCNKDFFENLPVPPQVYLAIMGWYLSDGSMHFRNNKSGRKPVGIRISQKKNGRLHPFMTCFQKKWGSLAHSSLNEYTNKAGGFRNHSVQEMVLLIRDKNIVNKLYNDCSCLKKKRIPRWVFGLSKRLMQILLLGMHRGDGTDSRPDNSKIYYSSLKGLADDFQELALLCGFETSLYGPYLYDNPSGYNTPMYQVRYNKTRSRFKRCVRCQNIKKVPITRPQRVVCFTVPNKTLITRRNGHVAIHGNSKHATHLIRLLKTCREILEEGVLRVKRPDAEELLAIRNGAWTYEEIVEFAESEDKALDDVVKKSSLPKTPDIKFFDSLVREMILKFNRKG